VLDDLATFHPTEVPVRKAVLPEAEIPENSPVCVPPRR
jgi:hypothetical protein